MSKVTRFARTIPHKHCFIGGKCEFCDIWWFNCKHEAINITQTSTNDKIITICGCGKRGPF